METSYKKQRNEYVEKIEKSLHLSCDKYLQEGSAVSEAARYSLLSPGKRVRGCLVLAFTDVVGGMHEAALEFATAVEMIHAYSLIHDDLPCMDDDDLRRGKPSCHIQFGEDIALLAGDALLTLAFEVIANTKASDNCRVKAISAISRAIGTKGMIFGQELDMKFEEKVAMYEELIAIHDNKTGALIKACMELGYITAEKEVPPLAYAFIEKLGLVYQMLDDLLDISQTTSQLGKPAKSDLENEKTTFISLIGEDETKKQIDIKTLEMLSELKELYGSRAIFLESFTKELAERTK